MAVYTKVTEADLHAFLRQYDLGAYRTHTGITQGVSNTNYHLETDNGRYILTLFEQRTDTNSLPFIFGFTAHLAAQGLPVPATIPNRAGGQTTPLKGKTAAIIAYLDGADIPVSALTPEHAARIGTTLARLHLASATYAPQRPNPMNPDIWQALLDATDNQSPAARAILQTARSLDTSALPRGAIHADLCLDNIFFDESGNLSGLIDFYFAATDSFLYDIAISVNAWGFESLPLRHAFITAYESIRPLTAAERAAWPDIRRIAALRIYATRQYDAHFTQADAHVINHDPAEYIPKMEMPCPLP